jgi:probable HAF family extracellular repeat protein
MTTIRRDLIKAAVGAKAVLGQSTDLLAEFLKSQINPDGGFRGRSSESDLYYTMFGIEAMTAVCPGFSCEPTVKYLQKFDGKLDSMGLVDLGCYIRCMADVSDVFSYSEAGRLLDVFRTADGGYHAFLWTAEDGMVDLGTLGGNRH